MRARLGAGVGIGVLVISACGGGSEPSAVDISPDGRAADETPSDETVPGATIDAADDPDALAAEILALPEAERNDAIAAIGMDMELAIAAESGLEDELGGVDATRDTLVTAWAPIVADAMALSTSIEPAGFRRLAAEPPSLGEGLFGGFVVAGLGGEIAARAGREATADRPISDSANGLTVVGSLNHGELAFDKSYVDRTTGVTTSLKAKITMQPCPDAAGHFEATGVIDVDVTSATATQHAVIEVDVTGEVDDDAQLASSVITGNTNWTDASGAQLGEGLGAKLFEALLGQSILDSARRSWESGGCVRIDVTDPGTVRTNAIVDVTAAPRSVIDGGPTGGTVTATFSGKLSAEPLDTKVDADATFVYTAPDESGSGTLTFEARSRRGVGKGKLVIGAEEPAYIITGTGPEIVFSGTTTDIHTFYVTGTFPGGTAEFAFSADVDPDPDRDRLPSGDVTITGSGSGVTMTGSGRYTIVGNPDGTYTATVEEQSCVHVPGPMPQDVCRPHTFTLTLTPEA